MTCKICHDRDSDYECFCGCHFIDTEGIQMGLKRCDNNNNEGAWH